MREHVSSLLGWLDELSIFVGATVFDIPIKDFASCEEPREKLYLRDEMLTIVATGIHRKFFKKMVAPRLKYFEDFASVKVQWRIPGVAVIRFYFRDAHCGVVACNAADEYLSSRGNLNVGKIFATLQEGSYAKNTTP
jgi:hypothetical protein